MKQEITKLANGLYKNAEVKKSFPPFLFWWLPASARPTALIQKLYGGLWVGGSVTLSTTYLQFNPNAMNRALHDARTIAPIVIPLAGITSVKFRFGVLTKIVDVAHAAGNFIFRCYGAESFVVEIDKRRSTS